MKTPPTEKQLQRAVLRRTTNCLTGNYTKLYFEEESSLKRFKMSFVNFLKKF